MFNGAAAALLKTLNFKQVMYKNQTWRILHQTKVLAFLYFLFRDILRGRPNHHVSP